MVITENNALQVMKLSKIFIVEPTQLQYQLRPDHITTLYYRGAGR